MGWVRLDDSAPEHPKVARLSDSAFALWVCSIAYGNRNLTDGFVPSSVGNGQLRYCDGNPVPAIRELEAAGLWEQVEGGWHVHDYLDFQPSRASVLAEREAARDRMARRRSPDVPTDVRDEHAANLASGSDAPNPKPLPNPNPEPKSEKPSRAARARRVYTQPFEAFWQAYPSEGRQDKPKVAVEFEKAVARLAAELATGNPEQDEEEARRIITEAAARFAADPNRDPSKTKYAQGWLSGDRWNAPPLAAPSPNGRPVPGARSHALARELGS